jgi:hypothetical protein
VRPILTEPLTLPSGERVPLTDHPILMATFCLVEADDEEDRCLPLSSP